jgi:uncharacterized protein
MNLMPRSMTTDPLAVEFWNACERSELRYQTCDTCKQPQFYPRPFCAKCGSEKLTWATSKGAGTIYALTTVERAPSESFRALQPYSIALVDLDEGFRIMAHAELGVTIGERVRATYFAHGERNLPRFVKGTSA